jgi:acyl-CoA thioesterase-1
MGDTRQQHAWQAEQPRSRPRAFTRRVAAVSIIALVAVVLALYTGLTHLDPEQSLTGSPHSAVTYEPANSRPAIVCLGDSLTAGDGAPPSQSYPAWLQRQLDAAGYKFQVVNAGHSGDRVADGLARLQDDVLRFHPVLTIVELGSNDPGNTPADTWQRQLSDIVAQLQAQHSGVILGGLDEPGMTDRYKAVGSRYGVPVVWFTDNLWSRPGLWANAHHPNGAGYQVVMQSFWPAVLQALKG